MTLHIHAGGGRLGRWLWLNSDLRPRPADEISGQLVRGKQRAIRWGAVGFCELKLCIEVLDDA